MGRYKIVGLSHEQSINDFDMIHLDIRVHVPSSDMYKEIERAIESIGEVDYTTYYYGAKKFNVKRIIFNYPATIVIWADGTKTVVKCQDGDEFVPEAGIAMCFMKKAMGNKSNFNNIFKKWVQEEDRTDFGEQLADAIKSALKSLGEDKED
jgi:hypothetical protein